MTSYYNTLARESLSGEEAAPFDASAQAYAQSALRFCALVSRKRIPGLMQVYGTMPNKAISFDAAVKEDLGCGQGDMHREMVRVLRELLG